ncbi:hypothetical protein FRC03_002240 [Tulasnella sp. 419]|nr:hypothetical protein FRC03_002240 [Tulasnella sp. 419]
MNDPLQQSDTLSQGSPVRPARVNSINNGQPQSSTERLAALLEKVGLDGSDSESGLPSPSPSPSRPSWEKGKASLYRNPSNASEFGVVVDTKELANGRPAAFKPKQRSTSSPSARLVTKPSTSTSGQTSRRTLELPLTISSDEDVILPHPKASNPRDIFISNSPVKLSPTKLSPTKHRSQEPSPESPTRKLRTEIEELKKRLEEQQQENTRLKDKSKEQDEFRESVSTALTCQICWDILQKPYALNPCGHVCCLVCLQSWFKGDDGSDPSVPPGHHRLNHLRKTCPYCRARIYSRPIPLFIVKTLIETLNKDEAEEDTPSDPINPNEDPWAGIFPDPLDDSTDYSDDSIDSMTDEGDALGCDFCGRIADVDELGRCSSCALDGLGEDSETDGSGHSDLDDRSIDGESDNASFHSGESNLHSDLGHHDQEDEDAVMAYLEDNDHRYTWVRPRWSAPYIDLDRQENLHITNREFKLCCRGVPFEMIAKFNVQYDPPSGLSAEIDNGLIYLGYNLIDMDIEDIDGSKYIRQILYEMQDKPLRYEIDRVTARELGYEWVAWRLVTQEYRATLGHVDSDSDGIGN